MSRAPDHQRDKVVAEASEEQGCEQVDPHDHCPCMVMNGRYWFASIKEMSPGNPSCRSIIHDSTRQPAVADAVSEYGMR